MGLKHLPSETLAALAEGRLDPPRRSEAEAHLGACPSCFEAYSEVVKLRINSEAHPEEFAANPKWVAEGIRVAGQATPVSRSRGSFRGWRLATAPLALVIVIAAVLLWPRDRALDTAIAPVQRAVSLASHHGLVYPEADLEAVTPEPSYRSGNGDSAHNLGPSIDKLRQRLQRDPENRDIAYWFIAALTESGQLGTARSALDGARSRLPADTRLTILDAILSAREQDFERARRLFRETIEADRATGNEKELARQNLKWMQ